jgi:putative nucleotidyltransferase with HDIG domain
MVKVNKNIINLNIPAVPHVALKIMSLLDDPYVSLKDLESLITADPSLSAKILKIANSAFYGLRNKVTLISDAINVMGFKTLKDIVLVASMREIYKVFGLIEKMLWEHGVGVSLAGSIITEYVPIVKKEEASLAGLMHDIGKIILNNNFPSDYVKCVNLVHQNNLTFIEVEREIFGFTHLEVGAVLAEKWGFSKELKTVILNHNNLDYIKNCSELYEKTLLLGINLADSICTRLGIGYKEPKPQLIKDEEEVISLLGLGEKKYSEIANRLIDTFPGYLDSFME